MNLYSASTKCRSHFETTGAGDAFNGGLGRRYQKEKLRSMQLGLAVLRFNICNPPWHHCFYAFKKRGENY